MFFIILGTYDWWTFILFFCSSQDFTFAFSMSHCFTPYRSEEISPGAYLGNVQGIIWGMSGASSGIWQQSAVLHVSVMPFLIVRISIHDVWLSMFICPTYHDSILLFPFSAFVAKQVLLEADWRVVPGSIWRGKPPWVTQQSLTQGEGLKK